MVARTAGDDMNVLDGGKQLLRARAQGLRQHTILGHAAVQRIGQRDGLIENETPIRVYRARMKTMLKKYEAG